MLHSFIRSDLQPVLNHYVNELCCCLDKTFVLNKDVDTMGVAKLATVAKWWLVYQVMQGTIVVCGSTTVGHHQQNLC